MIEIVFAWDLYQSTVRGEFFRLDHIKAATEAECLAIGKRVQESTKEAFGSFRMKPFVPEVYCAKRPVRTKSAP